MQFDRSPIQPSEKSTQPPLRVPLPIGKRELRVLGIKIGIGGAATHIYPLSFPPLLRA